MGIQHYILKGREVVPVDLETWARSFEDPGSRKVAYSEVRGYRVSTVFLGLNYAFSEDQAPELFETMVFPMGNYGDFYCARYSTYDEAEAGHAKAVEGVREGTLEMYGRGEGE